MNIFELQEKLLNQSGTHFLPSTKLDNALLSAFDREQNIKNLKDPLFQFSRVGPYCNIELQDTQYTQFLSHPYTLPEFKKSTKRFWLEYLSPNIAKELHIGHVRNTNIGISLENMLRLSYPDLVTDSHLGDWGVQFGILLWSLKKNGDKDFEVEIAGEKRTVCHSLVHTDPGSYYTHLYVWGNQQKSEVADFDQQVRHEFLLLTQKDPQNIHMWSSIVNQCRDANAAELRLLNLRPFDYELGESHFEEELSQLLEFLGKHSLLEHDGNALYIDFTKIDSSHLAPHIQEMHKSLVANSTEGTEKELGRGYWVSSTGYSTYLSRDVAARINWIRDYGAGYTLTITDNSQNHHMRQLMVCCAWLAHQPQFISEYGTQVASVMKDSIEHLGYGRIILTTGKMSTRKGNFVTAKEMISSTVQQAKSSLEKKNSALSSEELDHQSQVIARAAIKWNDLKVSTQQDTTFDPEAMVNFEGNTGVYQLYTYARLKSIIRKAETTNESALDASLLTNEEKIIAKLLFLLPCTIKDAMEKREPHKVTNFLHTLAQKTNSWYAKTSVLKEENSVRKATLLALISRITEVQKIALELLGITVVESL